ncbi:PREDICTED: uncharacterized protein LOC104759520 [Camelina sativa]|uniref:Uncharacterized protein LOC104759520 n=1 Tax=Camelina sativa TaxID=90675 RepID=A0ABM0X4W5_CAMSA|nr:PREDICTED: uncharacterized protein LOC104759520 [Camelina sativa]
MSDSVPIKEQDPARKHATPVSSKPGSWTCNYCKKITSGGVQRAKQHIVGGYKKVTACTMVSDHTKEEVRSFMLKKAEAKATTQMMPPPPSLYDEYEEDEDEGQTSKPPPSKKRKGPMDMYVCPTPPDVLKVVKDAHFLFDHLDRMVEEVGESNVVQVITDNASNYIKASQLLMANRPHLYWLLCAAHCIDLMLEDIGKIPMVKTAIKNCIYMNDYFYSHTSLVNMMRKLTQGNLHRPAVTRFATLFITLSQYHKQRKNLRSFVTSQEWNDSKWSKDLGARNVKKFIMQNSFWHHVLYALKLTKPLVKVLRLVDGERKPAMGYIYKAMDRAKEAIARTFNGREEKYKDAFAIIDKRWDCQLHHPLHAAGYYLNPEFQYNKESGVHCEEVEKGFYNTIERLVPSLSTQDKLIVDNI